MKYLIVLVIVFVYIFNAYPVLADNKDQFITITNPVRISAYTPDPISSLLAQYKEISKRDLPATWLLTYDVLDLSKLDQFIKNVDTKQEFGIWMEVTPILAEKSGVIYNKSDSWHRSKSVFLSGYQQEERTRMIDTTFNRFKQRFGYYPKSVGAWWIDAFSLEYMQKKYGITANLVVTDQESTDGYHVWGQYWFSPYYPTKLHAAVPAQNAQNKINVVNLQWAARDPFNGYGPNRASLFSTQDWFVINLPISYLEKLINLYTNKGFNEFGHMVIGLEGDLEASSYSGIYASELELIKNKIYAGELAAVTMSEFADWYIKKYPDVSPEQVFYSNDLLEMPDIASFWYQSPKYRIGFKANGGKVSIVDFRTYSDLYREPYYQSPNKELDLYINLPSIIDSVSNPNEMWSFDNSQLDVSRQQGSKEVLLNLGNNRKIKFTPDKISFDGDFIIPDLVKRSSFIEYKKMNCIQN